MTGVARANAPTDTHLWLKMAFVQCRPLWRVSFQLRAASTNKSPRIHTYIQTPWHIHMSFTYRDKHSRFLLVVMVFCSTLRCNGPRHCSVRAISCCSWYNYTKWALWQTVGANVGVGHCGMWREELTHDGTATLSYEKVCPYKSKECNILMQSDM